MDKKQSQEWIDSRIAKAGSEDAKKYGKAKTDEERQHLSEINKGENGFWFGKTRDEDTVNKIKETKSKQHDLILETNVQKMGVEKFNIKTGALEKTYRSLAEASKDLGISIKAIKNMCKGGNTREVRPYILKLQK